MAAVGGQHVHDVRDHLLGEEGVGAVGQEYSVDQFEKVYDLLEDRVDLLLLVRFAFKPVKELLQVTGR